MAQGLAVKLPLKADEIEGAHEIHKDINIQRREVHVS